ncbi:MAG: hypothetical protein ACLU9S_04330 [Oscillospiraceae bacterium]
MEIPLSRCWAGHGAHRGGWRTARRIAAFGETLQARIDDIQRQIYDAVGYSFNLNSPKQLGKRPVREAGPAAGEKDQDRLFHQRRGAGEACGTPIPRRA